MQPSPQRPLADPAADAAVLLTRLGLAVLAIAVPVSAVVSRRAVFSLLPVGAGLLLVAAALLPRPPMARRLRQSLLSPAGMGGLLLLVWSALSLVWTPFPVDAAERWGKEAGTILLVVLAIVLLPERTRTSNLYLFPIGLAAAIAVTILVAVFGPQALGSFQDAGSTLERAVLSLVMLVWPAIGALSVRERWSSAGWLAVGTTVAAMAAWTSVALAALALGAIVFAIATLDPVRTGRILGLLVAVLFVATPVLPLAFDPISAALAEAVGERVPALIEIAQTLHAWATLVLTEPLRLVTGHGFDMATRAILAGYVPPEIPRSYLFETWYEFGVVGAVAAAFLSGGSIAAAGRTTPVMAPFLLAEITTGLVIVFWGLDTTELWWITLLGVAALAFAVIVRGQHRSDRPPARVSTATPRQRAAS